jgi:hypothetical protein
MFRRERFAYIASRDEDAQFEEALKGNVFDSTVVSLIEGRYTPNASDRAVCEEVGVDHRRLWMLRSGSVFRHTLTRPSYERFSSVRLRPLLPILDMKDNLRSSDRAALAGSSNYLVVITKGTDKLPAKASEIENLREQARVVARVPVLVGDHRLNVEIVSPKLDNTLIESRWQVLDSRLVFAALQSFQPIVQGGNSSGGVSEMSRVVSAGLENRRHMLVRSLERSLFRAILDRNPALSEAPSLSFQPKHITLDFKADVMNAILKLRDRGDISRETTLEELDFDQDVEAQRRSGERRAYDEVFQSGTPYSSPAQNPYGTSPAPISPGRPPGSVGGNDG